MLVNGPIRSPMTDLIILHAASCPKHSLSSTSTKRGWSSFRLQRLVAPAVASCHFHDQRAAGRTHSVPTRDKHSRCAIADGHVEMVDSVSPPPSPVMVQDHNLLSPPRRKSKRDSLRVPRPTRSASAPPERSSKVRTIDPRDRLSPRPISPDPASCRRSHIPIVVRPPTTLCMCIVSRIPSVMLTISQVRPKPF